MRKLFVGFVCLLTLICCIFSLSACKDDENENGNKNDTLTIEEIADRLYYLDSQGKIDLERTDDYDAEGWTHEINEELERYNEDLLQGNVLTVYYTDDETYILEFESVSDARTAMSPLAYWENEHRYSEWQITREGKIVLFGEKSTISLILEQSGSSSNSGSQCGYAEKDIVWSWNGYESATATVACKCGDVTHTKQLTATISIRNSSVSCTTDGYKTYTAKIQLNGYTYTDQKSETIIATGHTEVKDEAVAATCAREGLTVGSHCSTCGDVLVAQTTIAKSAHQYISDITAPTCAEKGYTTHTCKNCTDSYVDSYVNALGHNWSEWTVIGTNTVRNCDRGCNQRILSLEATYNGIRLLTGESVWKDDVKVIAKLADNTSVEITDFSLSNTVMQKEGSNSVSVTFKSLSTTVSVPAIYDNLPGTTAAADFEISGESNDAITITKYVGKSTQIVIPAHINRVPVRYIGNSAFKNYTTMTALTIPSSVQTIDRDAFSGCSGLTTLKLNEGLKTINGAAFSGCPITTLTIPDSVVTISSYYDYGYGAFENCQKLTSVTIGNGLTEIDQETFRNCTALKTVIIGDFVATIDNGAFYGCSALVNLTIGKDVQTIGYQAFYGCSGLAIINIPSEVKTIGHAAFANCTALKEIEIPSNVQTIDRDAFSGCSGLTTLKLNEGLKTINGAAFSGCPITTLTIPDSVVTISSYYDYGYGAFENCQKLTSVTIGNGLTEIDQETFRNCTALKTVVIGDFVATIDTRAFDGCTSLTNVTIGSGVQVISNYAFANCTSLATIHIPENVQTIGEHAFSGCTLLDDIVIGTGVRSVGSYAFEGCKALTTVTIPSNVQTIGSNAFKNCTGLQEVVIEKGVMCEMGANIFNGCSSLDRLYYTGTADDWALIAINSNNVYPLSVTPYYFSSAQPTTAGNYWYYNTSNAKRVWDVSEDAYRAEEYSENFAEIFGDESSSYATIFYNDLQKDTKLMLGISAWELIHITAEPTYIFDPNNSLISKKDLYKLTLYDIMTGEDAETKAAFFEFFDQSSTKFMLYVGNMYLGDPIDAPIDIDMLYQVLHNKDASAIQTVLKKAMSPTDIECAMAIISFAENAYEALESVSQYVALRQIKSGYVDVLMAIYNDTSNPSDLRNAALELVNWYQEACELTLAEFQMKTFIKATNEDIYSWTLDKLVDVAIDSDTTGLLKAVNFTGKAIRAIAEPLKLDAFCQAYYQLKTSVGVESALRKLIQVTVPDYMRYENQGTSETYMCTVELYENSVLCGFDYSIDLLTAYVNSSNPDEEGMEDYRNLVATLNSYKEQKQIAYSTFDNAVSQKYEAYYS